MGESFCINIASINIIHSDLITHTFSIKILLLHGSNLHWLVNARYLLLYSTCKLLLSVSNLKQVCEISCIHNENSEETDTNIHRPTISRWNALWRCRFSMVDVISIIFAMLGIGNLRFCLHICQPYSCNHQICHSRISYRLLMGI